MNTSIVNLESVTYIALNKESLAIWGFQILYHMPTMEKALSWFIYIAAAIDVEDCVS